MRFNNRHVVNTGEKPAKKIFDPRTRCNPVFCKDFVKLAFFPRRNLFVFV